MSYPPRATEEWKTAMRQAGYRRAEQIATFHFSRLADPCGDRMAAERAYRALLEDLPDSREALEGLAFLLQLQGRRREALAYRHRLLQLHAQALGVAQTAQREAADYLLAAETGDVQPAKSPPAYVEGLFDNYAGSFDGHLRDRLHYRGPELLWQLFVAHRAQAGADLDVLDLGCGTGLAGLAFKPCARRLDGIDLSQKMLDLAADRGIYDQLDRGDIGALLRTRSVHYDLVIAADVLAYFGDLQPLLSAVHSVLKENGLFVFSVEKGASPGYRLCGTGRYQHSEDYVRDCARRVGLDVVASAEEVLREQLGQPVIACVMLLRRTD
jgi:predicted TPR repeat methyltransferase